MTVHHGTIKDISIESMLSLKGEVETFRSLLLNKRLQDIQDWKTVVNESTGISNVEMLKYATWLNHIIPTPAIQT